MSAAVAISGTRRQVRELVDGTLEVKIHVDPRFKKAFHELFPEIDAPVAIAPLRVGFEDDTPPATSAVPGVSGRYGEQARLLRLSSFFRTPVVWAAIGTDAHYHAWVVQQPCCADGKHEGDVVGAHVRRIANGSGTAIKPPYSEIPLCHAHHSAQHQRGESAIGGKEWCDKRRIEHVQQWAWETLKAQLGFESWADVPPARLAEWAVAQSVDNYLPSGLAV